MSAHTPGPWRYYDDGGHPSVVAGTDEHDDFQYVAQDVLLSDVRLIAAAPELLAACESFLRASDCLCRRIEWDDGKCMHDLARAAIAKARSQ